MFWKELQRAQQTYSCHFDPSYLGGDKELSANLEVSIERLKEISRKRKGEEVNQVLFKVA